MSWSRCLPITLPEITKNVDARDPWKHRWECVIYENRQDRECAQTFNITSNTVTASDDCCRWLSLDRLFFGISHPTLGPSEEAILKNQR